MIHTKNPNEIKLTPVPMDRLRQIIARLFMHYRCDENGERAIKQRYMNVLKHYPEDLLCAAYIHVVKHSGVMPEPCDLIAFMEPEMQYRMQSQPLLHPLTEEVVA